MKIPFLSKSKNSSPPSPKKEKKRALTALEESKVRQSDYLKRFKRY